MAPTETQPAELAINGAFSGTGFDPDPRSGRDSLSQSQATAKIFFWSLHGSSRARDRGFRKVLSL
jgi:hypothetical protein